MNVTATLLTIFGMLAFVFLWFSMLGQILTRIERRRVRQDALHDRIYKLEQRLSILEKERKAS